MLTADDVRLLLKCLGEETVVEPTQAHPYRISRQVHGYSKDEAIRQLQAKLSIMLEASSRRKQA